MKKLLTTVLVILSLTTFGQSYPQSINVGSTANDGTGDKVRTAFQKVNANFTDIYGKVISGPVNGTKYSALKQAVKYVYLTPTWTGYYYYIKRIKSGVISGGDTTYRIEVAYANSITGSQTVAAAVYNVTVDSFYTVTHALPLVSGFTPGGITGVIVIDFSLLATNTDYTCSNFKQGGIFAPAGGGTKEAGGGGAISEISAISARVDGLASVYKLTDAYHRIQIDTLKNVKQGFTLIMADTADSKNYSWVRTSAGQKINGDDSIKMYSGEWLDVLLDSTQFVTRGGRSLADSNVYVTNNTYINAGDTIFFDYPDNANYITADSEGLWMWSNVTVGEYLEVQGNGYFANRSVTISPDSALRMTGTATVWDDLFLPFTTGQSGAAGYPAFEPDSNYYTFVVDSVGPSQCRMYYIVQMPHRWKYGSAIHPHVHYKHETGVGTPKFIMKYKWVDIGGNWATTPWTWFRMDNTTGTTDKTHQLSYGAAAGIAGTGKGLSSILLVWVYLRDTPTNVKAYQFDIHYEIDKLGSNSETSN